ncbi:MAG: hypothetical protein ACFFAS_05980 [Promethearchaeota archaeon]
MLLYENKKGKLISLLKVGLNPFKKFVSTGEIKEELGLVKSRKHLIESIAKLGENKHQNIILPVIGDVGVGKTHFFWALKDKLLYYNTIYISLENIYKNFYYNIYSEFIEEMGIKALRSITSDLCNQWGALEKKFGFFHLADINKVRNTGFSELSDQFENKMVLKEVLNVITTHQLDPYKKIEAENWLLGEPMDYKDLSRLNTNHDLKNKKYAFTILKLSLENSKLGCLLFIDDFERLISMIKRSEQEEEESEDDIFSSSWLYGRDESAPDALEAQKIFKKISTLNKIKGLKIILTLKSKDSLEEIKRRLSEENYQDLISIIEEPIYLDPFTESDFFHFYKKIMKNYLNNLDFLDFFEENPDILFPLNEKLLKRVYESSKGNPRQVIKALIKIFNKIIYSNESIDDILLEF